MRRWSVFLFNLLAVGAIFAADELPASDPDEPMEIEPPMLILSRAADGSPLVADATADVDVAKLERDLARAQRNASGAEHLYKAGIISKVEAEERALKVVRLTAKLADARLEEAKRNAGATNTNAEPVATVAQAAEAAAHAADERRRAELEAALRNLQRQQKLLALGSGHKSDVNRAEQKLAELQRAKE